MGQARCGVGQEKRPKRPGHELAQKISPHHNLGTLQDDDRQQ
jgi:hypothetical protein